MRAIHADQAGGQVRYPGFGRTPVLWDVPSQTLTDFGVGGALGTIFGMTATHQAGELGGRASLWSGTPESRVQLWSTPSSALAIAGDQQVGWTDALAGGNQRAAMWRGSMGSYVSLHPAGATFSYATATDGTFQGGYVERQTGPNPGGYAVIWNGTPEPIATLNPPGHTAQLLGMVPGQQVGWTVPTTGSPTHAALWRGSAASWVDLNPSNSSLSQAWATAGTIQVGGYAPNGASLSRACAWFGTAESVVNLHSLLPPGYISSVATCVSVVDGITHVGGLATRDFQNPEAFVWTFVPAPGLAALLVAAGVLARGRRPA
ncbi:MAG: hypothetical protein JNM80_03235 [Phycisphaerae bacterium]|nr:hypothetical protein [Phycisphaerae bacterium]